MDEIFRHIDYVLSIAQVGFQNISVSVLVGSLCVVVTIVVCCLLLRWHLQNRRNAKAEETNFNALIGAASDAIFSLTFEGIVTSWNEAAERLYGFKSAEVLGTHYFPVIAAGRSDAVQSFLAAVENGDLIRDFYAQCKNKNGAVLDVMLTGVPIRDHTGKILGTYLLARHADNLTRSEEVQVSRAIAARLRAIVDHSPDALALASPEGRTLYCNSATGQLLGCPPHETWGCSIFEYVHEDDRAGVEAILDKVIVNAGKRQRLRTRIRHKSGSWLWVEVVLTNLLDVPAIRAILINFRDITEALSAEEATRQSNERFARAFRRSPLPLSICTREEGKFIDVNDAYLDMFGLRREDLMGQTSLLNIWLDPEDRSTWLQELQESHGRGKPVVRRMRHSNGQIRDVLIYGELIEMDGQPCVVAITQDVTVQKRIENQFLRSQRMEAVGRLAGGLAHDFNNVLGVIIGHCEIAEEQIASDHPVVRNIRQIKRAADRAASLIRQLLAFSRQQLLYPRVVDLNAIVRAMNEMLVPILGEDISIEFRPALSLSLICADAGQIEQVIMNLVINARDAMPTGGKLRMETADVELDSNYAATHGPVLPGKYVMLSISDTGSGIPQEVVPHIFEPFFTTKGPGKGTGLGLSTAYGIVKQSNGYIWVYSEPDKGTTFKVYFPSAMETAVEVFESKEEQLTPTEPASETVLVVEDEESLRGLVTRLLRAHGYKVLEAGSAEAALQLVDRYEGQIDLLLTDVIMPITSGGELATLLRAKRPNLKVLFMSGYSPELVVQQGAVKPEMHVIEKPFTRNGLLAQVRAALQKDAS
jgi:two-component system cell cycle sensor histidine kinase/response regulator CckA